MQFVFDLIRDHLKHRPDLDVQDLSVMCINATNPNYLVFGNSEAAPVFVIKALNTDSPLTLFNNSKALYDLAGDLVAKPILLSSFRGRDYLMEQGLRGTPWFQLASHAMTTQAWANVKLRAIDVLAQLHDAIRLNSEWTALCNPGRELRGRYEECVIGNVAFSEKVFEQVALYSERLDKIEPFSSYFQHGDYCLNNLLFDDNNVHVIDFEDFGRTIMPMHDEFSLALSFVLLSPDRYRTTLREELQNCISKSEWSARFDKSLLPGFFLHHLFLRLGAWSGGNRRGEFRKWLLELTNYVLEDPVSLFE